MKQGTYHIGSKKEIKFEDVRKMSDEELWALFDDICIEQYSKGYNSGYDKGYDSGYDEAREECWW